MLTLRYFLTIAISLIIVCENKAVAYQDFSNLENMEHKMTINISEDKVTINLSRISSILIMKRSIKFSVDNIINFSTSNKPPKPDGFRIFGIYIPCLFRIGVFYSLLNKDYEYWDVNYLNNGTYYEFYLKDEFYKRVIIKSNNDNLIINQLKSLKNSKYWDAGNTQTHIINKVVKLTDHEFSAKIFIPPKNKAPKVGILFIQGSGPTDKDWNSPSLKGSNGSGKIIAELLAREGYCTLTFDKIGTSGNSHTGPISWSDYLEDQRAALAVLREEIPSIEQIFILGHSEGTIHAIKLFEEEKKLQRIDGLILLAPTGRTLQEIILSQVTRQINKIPLLPKSSKDRALERFSRGLDSIAEGHPKTAEELKIPFYLKKLYNIFCRPYSLAYSQEIFRYDPKKHLLNVDVPILLLAAKKDLQSIYEKDALALFEYAQDLGHTNVTLKVIKNSNHVFKYEPKPFNKLGVLDALAYNKETKVIDLEVIQAIIDWMQKKQLQ